MSIKKIASLPVDEFTTPNLITLPTTTSLTDVWTTMEEKNIRHIVITDTQNEVCGIISDRDVRMFNQSDLLSGLEAQDIMHTPVFTVRSGTPLSVVALEMSKNKYGSVLVYDDANQEFGIFTATDALNALVEILRGEAFEVE